MTRFHIGLDIGKKRDPAAIAIVEKADMLQVRHLERMPLGTHYPAIVERARAIVNHFPLAGRCALVVDATGVGEPVVDMLRAARIGCEITAVTITGGEREHRSGPSTSVPKRDLIAGLQVLLEQGELKIARSMRDTGALIRELMDIRSATLSAEGHGRHDDLVIALALACWRARRKEIGYVNRPLF